MAGRPQAGRGGSGARWPLRPKGLPRGPAGVARSVLGLEVQGPGASVAALSKRRLKWWRARRRGDRQVAGGGEEERLP